MKRLYKLFCVEMHVYKSLLAFFKFMIKPMDMDLGLVFKSKIELISTMKCFEIALVMTYFRAWLYFVRGRLYVHFGLNYMCVNRYLLLLSSGLRQGAWTSVSC